MQKYCEHDTYRLLGVSAGTHRKTRPLHLVFGGFSTFADIAGKLPIHVRLCNYGATHV